MSNLIVGSELSKVQLQKKHKKWKNIVWVIKPKFSNDASHDHERVFTGFSLNVQGFVMSCANSIGSRNRVFEARRLNDDKFFEVEVVHLNHQLNIVVLRVLEVDNFKYGKFAIDGSLFAGEALYHVGHDYLNLVGSVTRGRVAYQCVNDVTIPKGKKTA